MGINVITADDTLTLYGRVFNDFADNDVSSITYNDDLVTLKTGKNKNTIFSRNEPGNNAMAVIRLIRGSDDDRFMQAKLAEVNGYFPSVILCSGQFVKNLGDGAGNVSRDVYNLAGGTFTRQVDGKENVNGDGEQGIAVYNMKFANAIRTTIQ